MENHADGISPSLPTVREQDTVSQHANSGQPEPPRLVLRNLPFHQSKNRVYVKHNQGLKIFLLLQHDWFHVLLRIPTWQSLPFLLAVWTSMIIVFAGLYVWVDNRDPDIGCGLGANGSPIRFGPAFAFSLETCTTGKRPKTEGKWRSRSDTAVSSFISSFH